MNLKSEISNLKSPLEPLPLSLLNDFLYCPRRAALKIIEGWREANVHTDRGDIVHEHADLRGYESQISDLRFQKAGMGTEGGMDFKSQITDFKLQGPDLKSEILNLKSRRLIGLRPVEFKVGKRRQWENDDVQLCAQALCLEEMFGVAVPRGAVFHADSKRRREVEFTPELRQTTEATAAQLHRLGQSQISDFRFPAFRQPCSSRRASSVRSMTFACRS